MEPGIYVTFVDPGEPPSRELPPVGPLDQVVMRQHVLVAERRSITQAEDLGVPIDRWLEAELELQRAMGQEPGSVKRSERRFVANDGVFVRFLVFGDAYERDPAPEVGPFAVVLVGPRGVEADGTLLATRTASGLASWSLTAACGDEFAGSHKPDIALRSASSGYHHSVARVTAKPSVTAAPPPTFAPEPPPKTVPPLATDEPVFVPPPPEQWPGFAPRPKRETEIYSPQAASPPSGAGPELTSADRALIERLERDRRDESLRARVQEEERKRLGVGAGAEDDETARSMRYRTQPANEPAVEADGGTGLEWGAALWRTRFLIIGVLLVLVAGYYFFAIRNGTGPTVGGAQVTYVSIAQKFSSARWDYTINGVQRVSSAGSATARGEYYIVRVAATNRGTENLQLSPADFTLYDANGTDYRAASLASGPYQTSDNPSSPHLWPSSFPIGRTVTFGVIFDVPPGLSRGMLLAISDLPNTRVRLD